jgi:hypothetical protein
MSKAAYIQVCFGQFISTINCLALADKLSILGTIDSTSRKPAFDKDYLITTEDKEAFYFLTYSYSKAEVVQIDDHVLTIEQLRRNVTGGFMYDQVRPFSIASRSSCLQMSDVTYIANFSGYKYIRTYK